MGEKTYYRKDRGQWTDTVRHSSEAKKNQKREKNSENGRKERGTHKLRLAKRRIRNGGQPGAG